MRSRRYGDSRWAVYEGDFVDDLKTGRGIFLDDVGCIYDGEWIDNNKHGHGTLYDNA